MAQDKKILTVQDISCVGQCSLTVAQPIISACGVETCILPSAVLSNHTGAGFHGFTFRDLTEDIPEICSQWEKEGIRFDAVYTGYLGSVAQIALVREIMDRLLLPGGLKIVDPAMADNGSLYQGFDQPFVQKMAELCGKADIILPNLTEACFMTGMEYTSDVQTEDYVRELLSRLAALGARKVILKGISSAMQCMTARAESCTIALRSAFRGAAMELETASQQPLQELSCRDLTPVRQQHLPQILWWRAYCRRKTTLHTGMV